MAADGTADVWILDWTRDSISRLTAEPGLDGRPVWTPDGGRIVYASDRANRGTPNLYWQRADGTGDAQRLTDSGNPQVPTSWHPSGKFLAFQQGGGLNGVDVYVLPIEGDDASGWKPGTATPFVNSPFGERDGMFSPDGRWIAYASNESGRDEIYVRPFPGPGPRVLVSSNGGVLPTWSRARQELFYSTPDRQIMVSPYRIDGAIFRADRPQVWAPTRYVQRGAAGFRSFDLHPDGERFALSAAPEAQPDAPRDRVVFVFNFFDELRRVASSRQ
jgi:serine/threonine-protein kinase